MLFRSDTAYNFPYKLKPAANDDSASYKIGAIRRSSWCLDVKQLTNVTYSRIRYLFTNLHTGKELAIPADFGVKSVFDLDGNRTWNDSINAYSANNIVKDWHFSQTYVSTQNLQTGMPLYSYTGGTDSVTVLVLATTANTGPNSAYKDIYTKDGAKEREALTGGFTVTAKKVHINDLIFNSQTGSVRVVDDSDGTRV